MSNIFESSLTLQSKSISEINHLSFFENSLWDIKTAAQKLSISEKTLRDWVYKRQVPFKKVGNLVRFDPYEIHQWIEERSSSYGNRNYQMEE